MNKLEEQLRASRQTEVPGLQPPTGGWEAISGKLAAEVSAATGAGTSGAAGATGGGGTIAATTAKAILLKWLAGIGGLLMVASVTVYLATAEAEMESNSTDTSPMELADVTPEAEGVTIPVANHEKQPLKTTSEVEERTLRERPSLIQQASSSEATSTEAALQAGRTSRTTAFPETKPPVRPSQPRTNLVGITDDRTPTDNRKKPISPPKETEPGTTPIAETPTNAPSEKNGPQGITEPSSGASPAPATAPLVVSENKVAQPVTSSSPIDVSEQPASEAAPIPPASIKELTTEPTRELPTFGILSKHLSDVLPLPTVDLSNRRRNGKPKARAEWLLHVSISGSNSPVYNDQIYERVPAQQASQIFQLPGGETIYGGFRRTATTDNIQNSVRLRAGIDRQTSSGFLFRSGVGFYHTYTSVDPNQVASLGLNEIRVDGRVEEWVIPVELNMQYTFFKRHRLRPYVGIGMFTTLFNTGSERDVFTEGLTNQSGLVSGRDVTENLPLNLDISVTAGFQYKITSDWSVGAYLWGGNESNLFIDAPVGLEVRYTLK